MDTSITLQNRRRGLNRNQIKYLVIVAMLIDHIAWGFVDAKNPLLGGIMHFFGRLTGPTMAYFAGEGCRYTRDIGKYQRRLAVFALLSWIPFVYFEFGALPVSYSQGQLMFLPAQGVIYSLFLGVTAIRVWESKKLSKTVKVLLVLLLCLASCIGDWAVMDVLGSLFVYIYRENPKAKWTAFTLTFFIPSLLINLVAGAANNWFQLGVLLAPLLLRFVYNGEGGSRASVHKWFFYLFYPGHLLILGLLRWKFGF